MRTAASDPSWAEIRMVPLESVAIEHIVDV